nr:protein NUCLEAR FUSION DEFECTIVE 6, chloroplastic/mitochondrial-like isoform X3 [Ipomoea batatas]GMD10283.1 protein NUCLEAR FUSION DEFECTIVE 6, chloroplastic/mitochondrial-like isoform X3 [Ipomoea batatas]
MAAIAAKSVFCSAAICARAAATSSIRTAATRAAAGAKRTTSASPFAIPTQRPLTSRIFRSPVELSCVRVETMLPYHTATASALLNSMLSVAPRCYGWTLEGFSALLVSGWFGPKSTHEHLIHCHVSC